MASPTSLRAIARLLLRQPRWIQDRLVGRVERQLNPRVAQQPTYQVLDWDAALDALEADYPHTRQVLVEPALTEIEGHVDRVMRQLDEMPDQAPIEFSWNADPLFARACYVCCRLLKPDAVIETGVAYGVTSAFILQALRENGRGTLASVDLPPLDVDANVDRFVGIVVPDSLRRRWDLRLGASRRLLAEMVSNTVGLGMFVHDSAHTYRNMRREFQTALPHLQQGGMIVADDVQSNQAFKELEQEDLAFIRAIRQQGKPALFGIAITPDSK